MMMSQHSCGNDMLWPMQACSPAVAHDLAIERRRLGLTMVSPGMHRARAQVSTQGWAFAHLGAMCIATTMFHHRRSAMAMPRPRRRAVQAPALGRAQAGSPMPKGWPFGCHGTRVKPPSPGSVIAVTFRRHEPRHRSLVRLVLSSRARNASPRARTTHCVAMPELTRTASPYHPHRAAAALQRRSRAATAVEHRRRLDVARARRAHAATPCSWRGEPTEAFRRAPCKRALTHTPANTHTHTRD
jgi:hypothetical protein